MDKLFFFFVAMEENSRVCCFSSKLIIRQWLINETWPDIRYKIFDKIFVNVGCGPVIHHSTGSTTVYFSTVSNTRPDFSCMRHCFKLLEHDCRKKKKLCVWFACWYYFTHNPLLSLLHHKLYRDSGVGISISSIFAMWLPEWKINMRSN